MTAISNFDDPDFQPLQGYRVILSGSIPEIESWDQPALDLTILDFVAQFSAQIFKLGGHLVHGSHPAFTPVVVNQAERFACDLSEARPLTLVGSLLWLDGKQDDYQNDYGHIANIVLTPRMGDGDPNDSESRRLSLTALRLELVKRADAMVAVGGKFHTESGFTPGVTQELTIARWHNLACFVVAGLGGTAKSLQEDAIVQLCSQSGLERNQILTLAKEWDVTGVVGTVMRYLLQDVRSRSQGYSTSPVANMQGWPPLTERPDNTRNWSNFIRRVLATFRFCRTAESSDLSSSREPSNSLTASEIERSAAEFDQVLDSLREGNMDRFISLTQTKQ